MRKNQNGITFMSLVITVIVLMILTGMSISSGYSFVKNVRVGRIISNMTLVKAKAETIYDDYKFSNDASILGIGPVNLEIEISDSEKQLLNEKGITDFENLEWYKWDKNKLAAEGLDSNMLSDSEYYYINYENKEIIYTKKTSYVYHNTSGEKITEYYYSLTGLKNIYGQE